MNHPENPTPQTDLQSNDPSEKAMPVVNEPGESFEEQSPLLNEEVIERKNDIVLEAQPAPPPKPVVPPNPITQFGKPTLSIASPDAVIQEEISPKATDETSTTTGSEATTNAKEPQPTEDDLPRMRGEKMDEEQAKSLSGIQKKAGQTTAKWAWTFIENTGPKLQLFLTELDEAEVRKHVIDDLLPEEAIEFAKSYNESLCEEFRVKEWEKELLFPPLEEMLEQAGMNAAMSPGLRLGLGITAVIGARAIQTKKYRSERDELVAKLMNTYAKSKGEENSDDSTKAA